MTALSSILYVEDDPDIQAIGKLALETQGGYTVTTCDNGAAALDALRHGGPFQLILLDVMMPLMDGPSTLRAVRDIPGGRTIPVIFCTAKVQKLEIDSYLQMGAIGIIRKPFDAMTLAQEVVALWEQAKS